LCRLLYWNLKQASLLLIWRLDTQPDDNRRNDTQHNNENDTQTALTKSITEYETQHNDTE